MYTYLLHEIFPLLNAFCINLSFLFSLSLSWQVDICKIAHWLMNALILSWICLHTALLPSFFNFEGLFCTKISHRNTKIAFNLALVATLHDGHFAQFFIKGVQRIFGGETSPQPRSVGAPFLGPSEKGKNFFGVKPPDAFLDHSLMLFQYFKPYKAV